MPLRSSETRCTELTSSGFATDIRRPFSLRFRSVLGLLLGISVAIEMVAGA
jgi:hypothetical protein